MLTKTSILSVLSVLALTSAQTSGVPRPKRVRSDNAAMKTWSNEGAVFGRNVSYLRSNADEERKLTKMDMISTDLSLSMDLSMPTLTTPEDDTIYEVMTTDTNGCNYDGYEDLTSQQCQDYAHHSNASHEDIPCGGEVQMSNEPKGCHIYKCCTYFNTHDSGDRNINSAPVCKRSISNALPPQANPESYLVMNTRTNRCADGYEPLTPAECNMYTCFTNRPLYEAGSWPNDPKGCIISYGDGFYNQVVYFNEHPTGVGNNDDWRPVCKPSPRQFALDGPKKIVRTGVSAPDGAILLTPTDYRLSFTIEPLGTIREFGNIIQLTTGDRSNKAPAIFFSKDSTKLYIQISTDAFPDPFPMHQSHDLELNKSHAVVLTVAGSTSTLSVNGRSEVKSITARSPYAKLDVYIGSPWYEPANAIISDIQFFPTQTGSRSFDDGPL